MSHNPRLTVSMANFRTVLSALEILSASSGKLSTRNSRKIANKLMLVASGEINLQSKHNRICQKAKVKAAASAHSMAGVTNCDQESENVYDASPLNR